MPQSLDQQLDALIAAGVPEERIYSDKMSGARTDRPGLSKLLEVAREGDTVVVVALDRLGRSMIHVLETIQTLQDRGIHLKSLRESIDFSTPTGRMLSGLFALLAEYEKDLIKERAAAARKAASLRGKVAGRPRSLDIDQAQLARRMRDGGEQISTIARILSVSRATVYRVLEASEASA